jgi:hypothetical protein
MEPPAERQQEAHGGGPPHDPEGRHEGAHLLRAEIAQKLPELEPERH